MKNSLGKDKKSSKKSKKSKLLFSNIEAEKDLGTVQEEDSDSINEYE